MGTGLNSCSRRNPTHAASVTSPTVWCNHQAARGHVKRRRPTRDPVTEPPFCALQAGNAESPAADQIGCTSTQARPAALTAPKTRPPALSLSAAMPLGSDPRKTPFDLSWGRRLPPETVPWGFNSVARSFGPVCDSGARRPRTMRTIELARKGRAERDEWQARRIARAERRSRDRAAARPPTAVPARHDRSPTAPAGLASGPRSGYRRLTGCLAFHGLSQAPPARLRSAVGTGNAAHRSADASRSPG